VLEKIDLSKIKIRLANINDSATKSVSFTPSDVTVKLPDSYKFPRLECLEKPFDKHFQLNPSNNSLMKDRAIFAYDESIQNFNALEGELIFCSSAVIKLDSTYTFILSVLPHFITQMKRFKKEKSDGVYYSDNSAKIKNKIVIDAEKRLLVSTVEPNSIVFIDGPLVGRMATSYMVKMDDALRAKNCMPIYFVKNSDTRLVIDDFGLGNNYNSDFHWAATKLPERSRSSFFRYTDQKSQRHSKVFAYVKALAGFTERIEMHSLTYEKYKPAIGNLMDLITYMYIVHGDYTNPQVRPIVIAEKYAREGLRLLNIPILLGRLGFKPTVNQIRFG